MIGQIISHYKILEKLGGGGMGVVYKAVDTRLKRTVALKFLPPDLTRDEAAKRRFVNEAQAASALQHPNICTIHDIDETADNQLFIVMDCYEGETLKQKIERGPLKIDETLDIAIQITQGLTKAHEKGIVHRDIKPANVLITADNVVKIVDFGLAKLTGRTKLTKAGSTLGTVTYMSPEQARGEEVDARTDVWSLGVVMYEMITGRLPFRSEYQDAVVYSILNEDPQPMTGLRTGVPMELEYFVSKALARDYAERYQHVDELLADLRRFKRESDRRAISQGKSVGRIPAGTPKRSEVDSQRFQSGGLLWPIAAGFFLLTSLVLTFIYFSPKAPPHLEPLRYTIAPPENTMFTSGLGGHFALSPDGRLLTFVASDSSDRPLLWVRSLNSLASQPLSGTEGALCPFWSPDSRTIAFFAGGKLKKIEAAGGSPQTICDAPVGRGGTWNKDGIIVFAAHRDVPLSRVSAAGGVPLPITKFDALRHETTHRWPHFLPDGRHFLYLARTEITGTGENDAIFVSSLDTTFRPRLIVKASSNAEYANGYLFFAREPSLMAQRFDPDKLQGTGDIFPVAEQVYLESLSSNAAFSLSTNGILAFHAGGAQRGKLAWYDRTGNQTGEIPQRALYYNLRLSPDEKRVAVSFYDFNAQSMDVWLYEIARNIWERFSFDPAADRFPVWSPNGNVVVYASLRGGRSALYQRVASGAAREELLLEHNDPCPSDWSRDGRYLVFSASSPENGSDIWILPMTGDRKPFPFLQTQFAESRAVFSPDEHWIAYQSDESGNDQIYVRPFPGPGGKWRISSGGGSRPRWRRDGCELYYVGPESRIMAVDLKLGTSTLEVGQVRPLFGVRPLGSVLSEIYDVTADGRHFLASVVAAEEVFSSITLVVNWPAEVMKR